MSFIFYSIIMSFVVTGKSTAQYNYYCNTTCGKKHIACGEKACLHRLDCGRDYEKTIINDELRNIFLLVHNDIRDRVAGGDKDGFPPAVNMNALTYDLELEFMAQCFANTCHKEGKHDVCRKTSKFESVGQNTLQIIDDTDRNDDQFFRYAVKDAADIWEAESNFFFDTRIVNNYLKNKNYHTQHFAQLIWAETRYVGCGLTKYGNGIIKRIFVVCNYAPKGAIVGKSIYKAGTLGNLECNTSETDYLFLCGSINITNDWIAPFELGSATSTINFFLLFACLFITVHI